MSGAKSPRGEQPGRPGVRWETELRSLGEVVCDQDDGDSPFGWAEARGEDWVSTANPEPRQEYRPNRATRRAAAREARRSTSAPSGTPRGPQRGSSGLNRGEAQR